MTSPRTTRRTAPRDPRLQRLLDLLPPPARRSYAWLIRPEAKYVRLPLGLALIAGGALSFLPVLGLWMLPVGALLVGEDVPPVRRATLHALGRVQLWWDRRRPPSEWAPPSAPAEMRGPRCPAPMNATPPTAE